MRNQVRNLFGFVLFGLAVAGAVLAAHHLRSTDPHAASGEPAEWGDAELMRLPNVAAEQEAGERAIEEGR